MTAQFVSLACSGVLIVIVVLLVWHEATSTRSAKPWAFLPILAFAVGVLALRLAISHSMDWASPTFNGVVAGLLVFSRGRLSVFVDTAFNGKTFGARRTFALLGVLALSSAVFSWPLWLPAALAD